MKSILNYRTCRTLSIVLSVSLLSLTFSSCKKNEDNTPTLVAGVAVTNASSVAQDFYFENQKANGLPLTYQQTAGYYSVTGSPIITFRTSGTSELNGTAATNFTVGKYYNVFYTEDKNVLVFENDRTSPSPGKARVRFVNLSTGVGSSADFGITGGAKIVSGLAYKAISAYQEVDPSTTFSVYTGGSSTVLLSLPSGLVGGGIYTIYISGTTSATVGFKFIGEN